MTVWLMMEDKRTLGNETTVGKSDLEARFDAVIRERKPVIPAGICIDNRSRRRRRSLPAPCSEIQHLYQRLCRTNMTVWLMMEDKRTLGCGQPLQSSRLDAIIRERKPAVPGGVCIDNRGRRRHNFCPPSFRNPASLSPPAPNRHDNS